jgi:hypothetical protein
LVTLQWLITSAAVLAAVAAWIKSRRLARKLDRLTESYWELRYEQGQLRSRLNRLDPEDAPGGDPAHAAPAASFVPLSSLKR